MAEITWSTFMDETLKEILRTLQDYGQILRHIDGRIDQLEGHIELIRQNQLTIQQRETALEGQCQRRHDKIEEMLRSLAGRVTDIEQRLTPLPRTVVAVFGEEGSK